MKDQIKLKLGFQSITNITELEINEKMQSQFRDRIPKFSCNLATLSRRVFALHFLISGLAKQNTCCTNVMYEPAILVSKETA